MEGFEHADKDLFSEDDYHKDPDRSSYIKKRQGHLSDKVEDASAARKRPPPLKKKKIKVQ